MTIGKQDVLDTLNQPAVKRFKFTVGSLTVSPQGYADVCQAVSDGDIDVKPGGGSDAAYDSRLNTIFTQNGNPPLNVADRAQLLHECTHAIFDAYGWVANLREDEVAAYLAQLTFMFIVNPVRSRIISGAQADPLPILSLDLPPSSRSTAFMNRPASARLSTRWTPLCSSSSLYKCQNMRRSGRRTCQATPACPERTARSRGCAARFGERAAQAYATATPSFARRRANWSFFDRKRRLPPGKEAPSPDAQGVTRRPPRPRAPRRL